MVGDRGLHEVMKNGFLSHMGGEPEERLMVAEEDEEGEWVEEADEYVLADYTKIGEVIQAFKR